MIMNTEHCRPRIYTLEPGSTLVTDVKNDVTQIKRMLYYCSIMFYDNLGGKLEYNINFSFGFDSVL